MSDEKPPKNWWEFASNWTWGGLVFTCAFVFIEKLVEQNYGQALFALILGLGIGAVALHSKTWLNERTQIGFMPLLSWPCCRLFCCRLSTKDGGHSPLGLPRRRPPQRSQFQGRKPFLLLTLKMLSLLCALRETS